MEVTVKRNASGENELDIGPVTLSMSDEMVRSLKSVIEKRLSQSSDVDLQSLQKKLTAYKALASKMTNVDAKILQKLAIELSPEQLVTMVRLADGQDMFHKVMANMSKSNQKQFEDDYRALNKITLHQACVYMEQIVPKIKVAAQEQKRLQQEMKG